MYSAILFSLFSFHVVVGILFGRYAFCICEFVTESNVLNSTWNNSCNMWNYSHTLIEFLSYASARVSCKSMSWFLLLDICYLYSARQLNYT